MITSINEAKTLVKHTSYQCKLTIDSKKCNLNKKQNGISVYVSVKTIIYGILVNVLVRIVCIQKLSLMIHYAHCDEIVMKL